MDGKQASSPLERTTAVRLRKYCKICSSSSLGRTVRVRAGVYLQQRFACLYSPKYVQQAVGRDFCSVLPIILQSLLYPL